MNDYVNTSCPMGESYNDVKSRLEKFISQHLQEDLTYMIVTHGGIIKCFHGLTTNTHGMDLTIEYGESYYFKGDIRRVKSGCESESED